jgi:hypothetical protein
MASRQTAGTTSAFQYAPGQASSQQQGDEFLSANPAVSGSGSALFALVGTTINGQVVGPLEVWADCAVWDTTNSRFLRPGSDFDVTLLHRSGIGC